MIFLKKKNPSWADSHLMAGVVGDASEASKEKAKALKKAIVKKLSFEENRARISEGMAEKLRLVRARAAQRKNPGKKKLSTAQIVAYWHKMEQERKETFPDPVTGEIISMTEYENRYEPHYKVVGFSTLKEFGYSPEEISEINRQKKNPGRYPSYKRSRTAYEREQGERTARAQKYFAECRAKGVKPILPEGTTEAHWLDPNWRGERNKNPLSSRRAPSFSKRMTKLMSLHKRYDKTDSKKAERVYKMVQGLSKTRYAETRKMQQRENPRAKRQHNWVIIDPQQRNKILCRGTGGRAIWVVRKQFWGDMGSQKELSYTSATLAINAAKRLLPWSPKWETVTREQYHAIAEGRSMI
jgi:hypothetical protein